MSRFGVYVYRLFATSGKGRVKFHSFLIPGWWDGWDGRRINPNSARNLSSNSSNPYRMAPIREKQKVLHTNNLNAKQTMIAAQLATILNNFYRTFQMSSSRMKEKSEDWGKISPCFVFCCSGFTRNSECIFPIRSTIDNESLFCYCSYDAAAAAQCYENGSNVENYCSKRSIVPFSWI